MAQKLQKGNESEENMWQKFIEMFSKLNKADQTSTLSRQRILENSFSKRLSNGQIEQNSSLFLDRIKKIISSDEDREQLLSICCQKSTLQFCETFPQRSYEELVRIDSGSYAEVFRGYDKSEGQLLVFKVIRAISEHIKDRVRGPHFHGVDKFKEICSEFRISSALSNLNNQIRIKPGETFETHCFPLVFYKYLVEGDIPDYFLNENLSDSDRLTPIRKEPFEEFADIPREHAIIVMSYGGQPLWRVIKNREVNASQLLCVLKQITLGLAIAEAVYEFEHRDLHISNILLKPTQEKTIKFVYRSVSHELESQGYEAMIIDTTFSRIKINNEICYKDLTQLLKYDKPDQTLTSQDRVYKAMAKLTHNEWQNFTPKTTIKWLKYIYKIICNSSVMDEDIGKQPKKEVDDMIKALAKCDTLHKFIKNFF